MTQRARTTSIPKVEKYLGKLPADKREIVADLRQIIFRAEPNMEEAIRWQMPTYSAHGMVCYIRPNKDYVTFGFNRGANLTDPDGMFEGTGKGMRHLKIRDKKDIRKTLLTMWVQEAVIINRFTEVTLKSRTHPK